MLELQDTRTVRLLWKTLEQRGMMPTRGRSDGSEGPIQVRGNRRNRRPSTDACHSNNQVTLPGCSQQQADRAAGTGPNVQEGAAGDLAKAVVLAALSQTSSVWLCVCEARFPLGSDGRS